MGELRAVETCVRELGQLGLVQSSLSRTEKTLDGSSEVHIKLIVPTDDDGEEQEEELQV